MNAPYDIAAHAWLGASLALGCGLGLGLLLALVLSPKKVPDGLDASWRTSLADLDEQINHCVDQLRELDEQKARFEPEVFAQQKAEFEARAVALMQARQAAPKKRAPKPVREEELSATVRFLAARPQLRGFIWGSGLVGIVAFLYFLVNSQQVVAPPRAPMGGGEAPMAGASAGAGASNADAEEMKALQKTLTEKPDDVPALLKLAHLLLKNQMFQEAQTVNGLALGHDPNNVEGLVHAAVLQAAQGHAEEARADLDRLVHQHADFPEAWFFRGMLALQHGDQEMMKDSFRHYIKVAPPSPQRDRIEAMLRGQGG